MTGSSGVAGVTSCVMVTDEVLWCVMRCGYHQMILRIFRSVNTAGGGTRWLLAPAPHSHLNVL